MKKSKIEWTEATWNPSIGCSKISAGCQNCYAEKMANRLKAMRLEAYCDGFKFKILPERLEQPLKTKRPTRFFVNSMSDLFHEEMPHEFLDSIFNIIEQTPQHTYQILTKREKIMSDYFKNRKIPDNVWLGVTVEDKKTKFRIDYLRELTAKIKFISIEPLLEDLDTLDLTGIDWIIVGGESGPNARPMKEEWILNIKEQCNNQNSAFFFKQWGSWGSDGKKRSKKKNGRILKGKIFDEYPSMTKTA